MQEVVKRIKAEGFLPKSTFAIAKDKVTIISEVCVAMGVEEHFENSGCKVKSCKKPLFVLFDDACVLKSSVNITATTESVDDDLQGLLNAIIALGAAILIGIAVGVVLIIALLIVCCVCICGKKVKEKEIDEHDEENPEDKKEVAGDDPDADATEAPVKEVAGDDPDADATEAPVEAAPEEEESSDDDAAAFVTDTLEESTPLPKTSSASASE